MRPVASGAGLSPPDSSVLPPDPCAELRSRPEAHPLLEACAPFLIPKILQDAVLLKEYVRSEEFSGVRQHCGDNAATDILFRRALASSWDNPYVSLAIMFAAVLDHRTFGVHLPVIGPLLWFPLTAEFSEAFTERTRALPRRLFPDSPAWGDRDKLQHFFGSALVAALLESTDPSGRLGAFVEWGEERFIVEGTVEERDLEANRRGAMFGLSLLADRAVLPSAFMREPLSTVLPDTLITSQEGQP